MRIWMMNELMMRRMMTSQVNDVKQIDDEEDQE